MAPGDRPAGRLHSVNVGLGRDDFEYGQFGDNCTISGLADDEVCIGDQYQIGEALFEVTQPRVTCYRVGIRMNDPRIPALLLSHHRPGFYFRVLREGAQVLRALRRREPAARLAGLPDAHSDLDRARERLGHLRVPGRSGRCGAPGRRAWSVPDRAPASGR